MVQTYIQDRQEHKIVYSNWNTSWHRGLTILPTDCRNLTIKYKDFCKRKCSNNKYKINDHAWNAFLTIKRFQIKLFKLIYLMSLPCLRYFFGEEYP